MKEFGKSNGAFKLALHRRILKNKDRSARVTTSARVPLISPVLQAVSLVGIILNAGRIETSGRGRLYCESVIAKV
jgi:hypothetical protein